MIGFLRGTVAEINQDTLILDVNGVGYEMLVSLPTAETLILDEIVKVYTYLAVREDGAFLYGFRNAEEKGMFLKLISISGIGPKAAMSILSGMELNQLAMSIYNEDSRSLAKIKGIGKKTAERIILELKESILPVEETTSKKSQPAKTTISADVEDAIIALRGLGISNGDATRAVNEASKTAQTIEDLIRTALQLLN